MYGPNAGLTEVLIPAGYVTTVYDPVFKLSPDRTRYIPAPSDTPTTIPAPGLPFSLVFRAEPGREDIAAEDRRLPTKPPRSAASRRRPSARSRANAIHTTERSTETRADCM